MKPFRQLHALAVPLARANVDTDQIVPARYLQKPRSADFGAFLFCDLRADAKGQPRADFPLNQAAYAGAQILVAGPNFGCGSSREHAVWALADGGFRAVIAPGFGDIFYTNALKNGLLPIRQENAVVERLLTQLQRTPGASIGIDLQAQTVRAPDGTTTSFAIEPFPRQCLLEGLDEIEYTLTQLAHIEAFESALAKDGK
jgi:3-isopropylmalate/(R)-2-methylmalate dehydratase small subunit